jgi:hypothetical protein
MAKITREQFEADKTRMVARDDIQVDGLYGMHFVPPEGSDGMHLPLFVTGLMPHSVNGFQLLGRLITKDLVPSEVQLNPNPRGFFDRIRFANVAEEPTSVLDLAYNPGYLIQTTQEVEGLNDEAMGILTLAENQTGHVHDRWTDYSEPV